MPDGEDNNERKDIGGEQSTKIDLTIDDNTQKIDLELNHEEDKDLLYSDLLREQSYRSSNYNFGSSNLYSIYDNNNINNNSSLNENPTSKQESDSYNNDILQNTIFYNSDNNNISNNNNSNNETDNKKESNKRKLQELSDDLEEEAIPAANNIQSSKSLRITEKYEEGKDSARKYYECTVVLESIGSISVAQVYGDISNSFSFFPSFPPSYFSFNRYD